MKNRIIALILALAMLFAFASCDRSEDEIPPKDKDLTVEIETVEYDDASVEEAASRVSELSANFLRLMGKPSINDERKAEIGEYFKTDILPVLMEIPIYQDELLELIEYAEESVRLFDSENEDDLNPSLALDLYTKFSAALDAQRLGYLIYELQLLALSERLGSAKDKYDKYGGFYVYDVEYYTELIERAQTLGRKSYSDAFSVIAFMASSLAASSDTDGEIISVTPADVLAIMKKQGERFSSLTLREGDWQTVAAMCEEFLPDKANDNLKSKLLLSLEEDDFFIETAVLMPDLIDFYVAMTSDISEGSADIIEEGAPLSYERVLCGELVKNEAAFRALLLKMEDKLPKTGSYSLSAVKAYDREGYLAFLERDSVDAEGVISAIKTFDADPTEDNLGLAKEKCIDFIAGINPAFAYVYLYLDFLE